MPGTEPLIFDVDIKLFRNRLVLRQLGLAFGIPLILLGILMLAIGGAFTFEYLLTVGGIILLVGGILVALLLIAMGIVYGGQYQYRYVIDTEGCTGGVRGKTARTNRIANLLGAMSGNPTVMGSALLAGARQTEYVAWKAIDRVELCQRDALVTLHEGRVRRMVVFCPPDRLVDIAARCRAETGVSD